MKRRARLLCLAILLALLPCIAVADAPAQPGKKITKDFKDAPVVDVIAEINKDLPQPASIVFASDFPKDRRITLSLRDADPVDAMMLVLRAAGLKVVEETPEGVVISVAPTVSVGGTRVPLVGAISGITATAPTAGYGPGGNVRVEAPAAATVPWSALAGVGPSSLPGNFYGLTSPSALASALQKLPSFKSDTNLVDLEVKDAPIRDAMAKLSKASGVPIHVHEAVPEEIKITARLFRMPLGHVLAMIMDQSNLTYTVEYTKDPTAKQRFEQGLMSHAEYEASEGQPEIHVVPKPELQVSGPGVGAGSAQLDLLNRELASRVQGSQEAQDLLSRVLATPRQALEGAQKPLISKALTEKVFGHCPKCNSELLSRDWKFCPHCGAKLPAPPKPGE